MMNFRPLLTLNGTDLISMVSYLPPKATEQDILISHTLVYYMQSNESETKFARELYDKVKKEFPEVKYSSRSVLKAFFVLSLFHARSGSADSGISQSVSGLRSLNIDRTPWLNIQILVRPASYGDVRGRHGFSSPDWRDVRLAGCEPRTTLVRPSQRLARFV